MMIRSFKYRRFSAIFLDLLLITVLAMLLTNNTISNPYYNDYSSALEEYNKVLEINPSEYNTPEGLNVYINKVAPAIYNINKVSVFSNIWFVVLALLYFVIFQYSTGGQTLGKKIYKLKVTNKDGKKVNFTSLLFRSLFIGELYFFDGIVIISILNIIGTLLIDNQILYMYYYFIVNFIGLIYEVIMIVFFIKNKKNETIHDKISKTKVIEVK